MPSSRPFRRLQPAFDAVTYRRCFRGPRGAAGGIPRPRARASARASARARQVLYLPDWQFRESSKKSCSKPSDILRLRQGHKLSMLAYVKYVGHNVSTAHARSYGSREHSNLRVTPEVRGHYSIVKMISLNRQLGCSLRAPSRHSSACAPPAPQYLSSRSEYKSCLSRVYSRTGFMFYANQLGYHSEPDVP